MYVCLYMQTISYYFHNYTLTRSVAIYTEFKLAHLSVESIA